MTNPTGNPKGRPPKSRALTELLSLRGDATIEYGGEEMPRKEALAEMLWDVLMHGELKLKERVLKLESAQEWMMTARWVYMHVDGSAPKEKIHAGEVRVVIERGLPETG